MRNIGSVLTLAGALAFGIALAPAHAFGTSNLTELVRKITPAQTTQLVATLQAKYPNLGAELLARIQMAHPQMFPDIEAALEDRSPDAYAALAQGFAAAENDDERLGVITRVMGEYPRARTVAMDTVSYRHQRVYATVLQFIADNYPEAVVDLAKVWSDAVANA